MVINQMIIPMYLRVRLDVKRGIDYEEAARRIREYAGTLICPAEKYHSQNGHSSLYIAMKPEIFKGIFDTDLKRMAALGKWVCPGELTVPHELSDIIDNVTLDETIKMGIEHFDLRLAKKANGPADDGSGK